MFRKLIKKMNNRGSSFIMVIVSLAFLAILAASILSAAAYSYNLKLYNMNSKNNFYYVEQAMDEIYAGVGGIAIKYLQQAYDKTIDVMVYYEPDLKAYVTRSNEDANKLMKQTFLLLMKNCNELDTDIPLGDPTGMSPLANSLKSYITNDSVQLANTDKIAVEVINDSTTGLPKQVRIKNITVVRSAQYKVSGQNETYQQSITTDIVFGEPGYDISFANTNDDFSALYDFALVADSGIEIHGATNNVNISGDIYAGADYYNKAYNSYTAQTTDVSSYKKNDPRYIAADGVKESSMYSGIYIDGAKVTFQSNNIVVPGTFGIFNNGDAVVSAKKDGSVVPSELWVDSIVLGGYTTTAGGSVANLHANAYVYDDTEINADSSTLKMDGSYYGYNYNQYDDARTFISSAEVNYVGDNKNNHYNSSSIILNGQDTTLDFQFLNNLYIAGRSYIEMSKKVSKTTTALDENTNVEVKTYTYDKSIDDYITGESISVKSNQLAYQPIKSWVKTDEKGNVWVEIPAYAEEPYDGFFAQLSKVPVIKQTVSGNDFYFFDFGAEVDENGNPIYQNLDQKLDKEQFILDYVAFFNKSVANGDYDNPGAKYLKDITDYQRFQVKEVILPDATNSIYSNGALTVRSLSSFSIVASQRAANVMDSILNDPNVASQETAYMDASSKLGLDYNLMKFFLTTNVDSYYREFMKNYTSGNVNSVKNDTANADKAKEFVEMMESMNGGTSASTSITPLLKYFNVSAIKDFTNSGDALDNITYRLPSGYDIFMSDGDITVQSDKEDIQGIVIAKGDVTFDASIKSFQGLIVSGSKIIINGSMSFVANPEIVKAALRECNAIGVGRAAAVVACFKDYGSNKTGDDVIANPDEPSTETPDVEEDQATEFEKSIQEIEYQDIIDFENWKKNVE